MARKTRTPLTDEQRQLKREAELKLLADAVAELKTSEGWTRWLRVRKAFHRYSLNNQLLIALQKPDATRVAGFKKWLALGYCVRKGEKGLRIFAPVPPSKQKLEQWRAAGSDPKTKPRTFFRLTSVFDVSQVDPLPAPAEPVDLEPIVWRDVDGDELAELLRAEGALFALAETIGVSFELRQREGDGRGAAAGFYRPSTKEVVVYTDAAPNGQVATAVHELAHALVRLDRQDDDPSLDYAGEELVVESVAYTVLSTLGIDAGASSVPYLASWSEQAPIATIEAPRQADRPAGQPHRARPAGRARGPGGGGGDLGRRRRGRRHYGGRGAGGRMSAARGELEVVLDRLAADGVDVDPTVAEPLTLRLGARELRAGEGLEVTGDLPSVPRAPGAVAEDLELTARLIELLDELEGEQ